ncbi:DUF5828 family protein [Halosegnis longus]|uniref:Uncharacterized protein n=1 Tax=Halosegnis longus TaxID=2216012 RepID=A0AAJ4UUS2_9EURY|nr:MULTISPECIES: DUF5828 family protein [Halobacteriales]RNJ25253.1 hypothetical protein Nmn1133_00025 [Salella cibi]
MEESVAGFKQRGTWGDIVEHGERVTRALRELLDEDNDALEEWNEWRPKQHERLDEDVNEKTAQQASVGEGAGEREGVGPDEDVKAAGDKLADSYEKLDEPDDALERWRESVGHLARAADSAGRKALRKVEGAVYKNVMTQIAPYYFDNGLVSANVTRHDNADYALEININDDDLKIRVSNKLADYEQSVDRWHVDTEKVTEVAEAAEGVETPEEQATGDEGVTEGQSHPTTN